MRKSSPERTIRVKTARDLGQALGLPPVETAEMEFRSDLTCVLTKIIREGNLSHAEIAN